MSCSYRSKRNKTKRRARDATVPSGRFSVVDRHTTSSRKDKVPSLMAIGSSVSRVTASFQLYYACRFSAGRIFRSDPSHSTSPSPSTSLSAPWRKLRSPSSSVPCFNILTVIATPTQHTADEQTSVLGRGLRYPRARRDYYYCGVTMRDSVTYTRVH